MTDNDELSDSITSDSFDIGYAIRTTNLSVRCHIQPGPKTAVAGFIIEGTGSKKILLRALAVTSMSPALDLRLSLYKMLQAKAPPAAKKTKDIFFFWLPRALLKYRAGLLWVKKLMVAYLNREKTMSRLETFDSVTKPLPVFFKTTEERPARPIPDRPGWIPSHITENWDPDPYAYQTEEEQMPAGTPHNQLLMYIAEVLRIYVKRQGLKLAADSFLFYRDARNIKQRIAPDLMLLERRFPTVPSYDLDTRPPPGCVIEITSPESHTKDLQNNVSFYTNLGIGHYLAIDAITPRGGLRDPIELHLWQKTGVKSHRKLAPDKDGYFLLPEMNLKIAASGQRLKFVSSVSGEMLRDTEQWEIFAAALAEQVEAEKQRADEEKQRADNAEKQALETARQMLADGFAPAVVIKYTRLSAETVAALVLKR